MHFHGMEFMFGDILEQESEEVIPKLKAKYQHDENHLDYFLALNKKEFELQKYKRSIIDKVTKGEIDEQKYLLVLEKIVEKMESGEQSLEEALAAFQRGIELTRTCQQGLKEAEQRVDKLLVQNGEARIVSGTDDQD